jgi:midasin
LVEAARTGAWLVLDELNLAPTDVLEALNRLLDDNRELFLHETQTVVKPHPEFMLFATQNPPGSYGGRKNLSRAFRNRFVELHFEDIPPAELQTILELRCRVPSKFCTTLVSILKELQAHRQGTRLFAGKHGFITLRDLFRWAERYVSLYCVIPCCRYNCSRIPRLELDVHLTIMVLIRADTSFARSATA